MTAADLDAVLAIEQVSESAPHWMPSDYLACLDEADESNLRRFALVAEAGGRTVGFAVFRLLSMPEGGEAELESIAVAPELRGRGIGAALMSALLGVAKTRGAVRLDLEVRASNMAAIRLYGKAGMRENGRRRGYYRGPDEDAVLMSISL